MIRDTRAMTMQISDLDDQERLVFGSLIRMMFRSDGHISAEEEDQINAIGESLGIGEEIWHTLISYSAKFYPAEEDARGEVAKVTRPEAREMILDTLDQIAGADGVATSEQELLDWVRSQWD